MNKNIKKILSVRALVLSVLLVCGGAVRTAMAQEVNITPLPQNLAMDNEGKRFELPRKFTVAMYGVSDPKVWADMDRFVRKLSSATGKKGALERKEKGHFRLVQDKTLSAEGYVLAVREKEVEVRFATSAGCYYALQSFMKMLPPNVILGKEGEKKADYSVPCLTIQDEPRFAYRGFMLDVSRHFFTVEEVKQVLDIMSVYKMNRFHWHLTDDQGWRIEIKKYPKLTEVGSVSKDMLMNNETQTKYWNGKPYGPYFYTQDDVREIVQYAAERHIEVIPEVDMPGHMMAAMAAYPEFSCQPERTYEVWTQNLGLSVDILNVGNPKAVQFARDVVEELCQLFPGPDIHVGGDECPIMRWEKDPDCDQLRKKLGLESFRGLQNWFIGELAQVAAVHGKGLFAWNESVTSQGADMQPLKDNNVKIMCWVGAQPAARKATSHGLDVVITPIGPYYINRKQWNSPDEPFAAGPGNDSLSVTYNYVPVPQDVAPDLTHRYIGVQATFWTEFVSTAGYLQYLMLPRLMAVAEAGWTQQEKKNFPDFVRRFNADIPLLELGGYNYGKHYRYKTDQPQPAQ